jgi:hypothetical protein
LIKQWDDPELIRVLMRRERVGNESVMKRSKLEGADVLSLVKVSYVD